MSSIVYLIISILFIAVFLKIKKTDKEQNIIGWTAVSVVVLFICNAIFAFLLSYLKIPVNLWTLSIAYFAILLGVYFFRVRNKEVQKYYDIKDGIFNYLYIALVVMIIIVLRFGNLFSPNIAYITFDPAIHFESSQAFYDESTLLNFKPDESLLDYTSWRFASYTNVGILIKIMSPVVPKDNFYAIYILFEAITLLLCGIIFYSIFESKNNNKHQLFNVIVTILFLLGYPLNNLCIGFFYIGHVSNIFLVILFLFDKLDIEIDNIESRVLLFLVNIGVAFTYYLFIPILFLSEFLYFIIIKKNKFNIRLIMHSLLLCGVPAICIIIYFILPTMVNSNLNLANQIQLDGLFYNDVIGNFLIFIPLIAYYFIKSIQNRNINYIHISFAVMIITLIISNILMLFNIIKPYYISKFYYINWIYIWILIKPVYYDFFEMNKLFCKLFSFFTIFLILWNLVDIENIIIRLNDKEYNIQRPSSLFQVYKYNTIAMLDGKTVFYDYEIKEIQNITFEKYFCSNMTPEQIFWCMTLNEEYDYHLDYPVNNCYEYIKKYHKLSLEEYLSQDTPSQYFYLNRDFYHPEVDYNKDEQLIIEKLKSNPNYTMKKLKCGYLIKKVSD